MKIEIEEKRLTELLENEAYFIALQNGGVDNWEWYGDSIEGFDIPKYVSSELAKIKEKKI